MDAPKTRTRTTTEPGGPSANEVRLVGRVSRPPEERVLPSGDVVWTFRVVVGREPGGRSRQRVDALECAAWTARARRSVRVWSEGDVVEVTGSLRRRFFRAGAAVSSRVEVEMASGRLIRPEFGHLGFGWRAAGL